MMILPMFYCAGQILPHTPPTDSVHFYPAIFKSYHEATFQDSAYASLDSIAQFLGNDSTATVTLHTYYLEECVYFGRRVGMNKLNAISEYLVENYPEIQHRFKFKTYCIIEKQNTTEHYKMLGINVIFSHD